MPKRANSQGGDVGTPVALEKKMRGTCEMASGRMATRSVTRALSNKGSQDPLSSSESDQLLQKGKEDSDVSADMTGYGERRRGRNGCILEDPYEGCRRPVVNLWDTKKELEEVKIAMKEFDKWAVEHKRNYGSKKERNNRFLVFLQNKRRNDAWRELLPDCWNHEYDFKDMDKNFWEN